MLEGAEGRKKSRVSQILYNQQAYQLLKGTEPRNMDTSPLPQDTRLKLHGLFNLIEKELESLYLENNTLHEKIDALTDRIERESIVTTDRGVDDVDGSAASRKYPGSTHKVFSSGGKLRSHTNKLRYQTNKIMSGLKTTQPMSVNLVNRYIGHKDGVWDVAVSRLGLPVVATASADRSAKVWGVHSGCCLLEYQGHQGSVNSVRFHPSKELVLTTSGDGTAHIWQCAVNMYPDTASSRGARAESASGRGVSSEDELDNTDTEYPEPEDVTCGSILRTPLRALQGHSSVVISGDWLPGGDQVVTGGWDRLAFIWDASTGQLLNQMGGHDEELTHTTSHLSQRLVVTASKDSTFRLWDFRESIHSVMVFQGHQDSVTSAVFVPHSDFIVSGSDDRSGKVWDLRKMRTAVATIQCDSALNKISVNSAGIIAVPYDNRNVRLFDLSGNRVARLPRSSRQGHSRMVCSVAWAAELTSPTNLFTAGFDRNVIGWSVQDREHNDEKEGFRLSLGLKGKDMGYMRDLQH